MAIKRFSCNECGTKCTSKVKLEQHLKSHKASSRGKKVQKCKSCAEEFTSAVLLKKHQNTCRGTVRKSVTKKKNKDASDSDCEVLITQKILKPNDDVLKEQMFSKVQSLLLDGSKNSKKIANRSVNNNSLLGKPATLDAEGIQSMSLSIKSSLNSAKSKATEGQHETPIKSGPRRNAIRNQSQPVITKELKKSNATAREPSLKRLRKSAPKKTRLSALFLKNHQSDDEEDVDTPTTDVPDNSSVLSSENSKNIAQKMVEAAKQLTEASKRRKGKNLLPKGQCTAKRTGKRGRPRSTPVLQNIISEDSMSNESVTSVESERDDEAGDATVKSEEEDDDDYDDDDDDSVVNNFVGASGNQSGDAKSKPFTCAQCSKSFSRKYHLDRHLKLYPCSGLPPPSFPCQVCNRVYTRKDNLREHLRVHTGETHRKKKYQCTYCTKAFHGMSLLTIHVRKHTGEKPFACDFCTKRFPSGGALAKHRRTHTGEKPFACPECGFRFSLKGTLNRHLRVHTGVRPHQCLYCGKQFIQIGGLKAHLFYHTGENGFKCEECGKIFNRKARLQMHKLYVHVKLRPYPCESCPKSFTRKEDLHRHAILHTGEKPYKCPTCSKSFAIKPSLKLHLLTHTKEEPRSCHECGRAFIRKDCLLRHMRKRHRDLLDKILLDEKDEKFGEPPTVSSRMLLENDLCENIHELLSLLVEESTLVGFGWPDKPVDEVLEAVIRRCGHTPVNPEQYSYMDRMRENAKLLFTVVIDDNAVKTLLNNQTVDEVILHVLRLAKT